MSDRQGDRARAAGRDAISLRDVVVPRLGQDPTVFVVAVEVQLRVAAESGDVGGIRHARETSQIGGLAMPAETLLVT